MAYNPVVRGLGMPVGVQHNNTYSAQVEHNSFNMLERIMHRGVVHETLSDMSFFSEERLREIWNKISNPEILGGGLTGQLAWDENNIADLRAILPINSLYVQYISEGAGLSDANFVLALPLFPPHIQLPVKPGEHVWLISETADRSSKYVYWICRIAGPGWVDDLNYTHLDRQNFPNKFGNPGFPNGDGFVNKTLNAIIQDGDPYEEIVNSSESMLYFKNELVPRLSKRPGDLCIQGSNNTAIILGSDRGWAKDDNPSSSAGSDSKEKIKSLAASIDVVVGRNRYQRRTAPKIVLNTRSKIEVDKWDFVPQEGDPDFFDDASRIYVASDADCDKKLGLTQGNNAQTQQELQQLRAENRPLPTIPGTRDFDVEQKDDASYTVVKSDQIRIVARKDESAGVNGSIIILKEGSVDNDAASIMILENGDIHVTGKRIFFGRSQRDGGNNEPIGDDAANPADKSEPYMRFSDFKAYMNETLDQIKKDTDALSDTIAGMQQALKASATPGFGSPDAASVAASNILHGYKSNGSQAIKQKNDKLNAIKSTRIFGE